MRDIDFNVVSAIENSNKFQKIRFWKEKSVEDVVTLGPAAQPTLVKTKKRKHPTKLATKLNLYPNKHPSTSSRNLLATSLNP